MERFDIARCTEILQHFGGEYSSFEKLRPDSYEQSLAAHSLEHLEQFYAALFMPGKTLAEIQPLCPAWPPGHERAGQLPSTRIISEVSQRIRTEGTLNNLDRVNQFVEKIERRVGQLPKARQSKTLSTIIGIVGEELITAKMEGVQLAAQLDAVDRLQTQERMERESKFQEEKKRQKERDQELKLQQIEQGNRRIALLESKIKAAQAEIEKAKAMVGTTGAVTKETLERVAQELKLL